MTFLENLAGFHLRPKAYNSLHIIITRGEERKMKEYSISNQTYTLTVSDHGAEIRSLKRNGKELMWQADPQYWGRTSPILFPLVGNYWEKKSRYSGKVYEMSQHGFARDRDFELLSMTDDELVFELRESSETLEKYPFSFVLVLGYRITEDGVKVSWEVRNPSDSDIFFSIGGHPAFNCDLTRDRLLFLNNGKEVQGSIKANIIQNDGSGCLSDTVEELLLEDGMLQLSYELFDQDALIIENRQADTVVLLEQEERVTVQFDAPLFGIWSPAGKKAPFVCIEPWYGRCDKVGFCGEISEREYGNKLSPQGIFKTMYTIC